MPKDHTILLVDDDPTILHILRIQLSVLPYCILDTSSSEEALHIIRTRDLSVLICDMGMPEIGGNEILREARSVNPNTVSIVITGGTDHEATIRAINEGGVWKFLLKPWSRDEIVALVKEGVQKYESAVSTERNPAGAARKANPSARSISVSRAAKPLKKPQIRVVKLAPRLASRGKRPARRTLPFADKDDLSNSRYKFGDVIGEGGIGRVYMADDLLLGMKVAIKVLSKEFARDDMAVRKLKDEARIAMQLSHEHIVRLHNLQKVGDNYLVVMEYVEGRNFRSILDQHGKLSLDFVAQVVSRCSDAISYAHQQGILHQDLKPENVMLTSDGVVKIIDFGTAGLMGTHVQEGYIFGTPVYMSPEQLAGQPLDGRTDLFALGVIAFELLTGRIPNDGEDIAESAELADLPSEIPFVIAKAMAEDPDERWESVVAFADALRRASVVRSQEADAIEISE